MHRKMKYRVELKSQPHSWWKHFFVYVNIWCSLCMHVAAIPIKRDSFLRKFLYSLFCLLVWFPVIYVIRYTMHDDVDDDDDYVDIIINHLMKCLTCKFGKLHASSKVFIYEFDILEFCCFSLDDHRLLISKCVIGILKKFT